MSIYNIFYLIIVLAISWFAPLHATAHDITKIVAKVKPSVVGVGLYDALGVQTHQLRGSGFIIGDGSLVATNYHVVAKDLDPNRVQHHIVFSGVGKSPTIYKVEIIAKDPEHDLAILKLNKKLLPLELAGNNYALDGTEILLTGFPIGSVLGLYPATHRGIIAATTPDVIPSINARQLSVDILRRLDSKFMIYQLDITAYPGNSGSPIYDANTGVVLGILNKVFIKESKETVLEKPSGISYAIPIKYLKVLASRHGLSL